MAFRDDALAGLHIVISGGCGAIGLGIVKKLTTHGANVTVNDILSDELATDRLTQHGIDTEKLYYLKADLTDPGETDMLISVAREQFGPIHVVLCHIGMVIPKPLLEYNIEEWDETMAVNVRTAFLLGQRCPPVQCLKMVLKDNLFLRHLGSQMCRGRRLDRIMQARRR